MKKSLFVLAAGLLATTSAFATDVTNPFYVPMKGDFLSETEVIYQNVEHGLSESALFSETVSYGITKNLAVEAGLADLWLFDEPGVTGHDRYDNPMWQLGLKYNLVDCCKTNWKVQLGADYTQGGVDHREKSLYGYAKVGYQMDKVMPYATFGVDKDIGKYEGKPSLEGRLAAYANLTKKVSLDAGVNYEWDSASWEGKHDSEWRLDATLSYAFTNCMAVGLTGDYTMRTKTEDIDAYSVGVNFKVAF